MNSIAIRDLRKKLCETQAQFANRFGVSQITVAFWESGRSKPTPIRLNELMSLVSCAAPEVVAKPAFRPIQYLGSKQRLAEVIADVMVEVSPNSGRVADLFAGSGVVSHVLGMQRPVTAVDVQAYSQSLTKALLMGHPEDFSVVSGSDFMGKVAEVTHQLRCLAKPLLDLEDAAIDAARHGNAADLVQLMEFGSLAVHHQRPLTECPTAIANHLKKVHKAMIASQFKPGDMTATLYFGGPYFAYSQAIVLDAIHLAALTLPTASRDCVQAAMLSTASEIVNTVGKQFAQPMRLQKADGSIPPLLLQRALRDRTSDTIMTFSRWVEKWKAYLPRTHAEHRVECGDVIDFVSKDRSCTAFYADPPYTIDHYSRFYHVLETLIRRDSPRLDEIKKGGEPTVMRGVYRTGRHQSRFCIPSEAPAAFDRLMAATAGRQAPLVLSYSPFDEKEGHRPRLLLLDDLVNLAKRHYRKVELMEVSEHSHRKLNAKAANLSIRADAERLLICEI